VGHTKKNENQNQCGSRTASSVCITSGITLVARIGMILDVGTNKAHTPPGAENKRHQKANKADDNRRRIFLHNIHGEHQHLCGKWNTSSPRQETECVEDGENDKGNRGRIVPVYKVYNCGAETEKTMKDTGNPDELLP